MCISNVDKSTSKKLAMKLQRTMKEQHRINKQKDVMSTIGDNKSALRSSSDNHDDNVASFDSDSDGTIDDGYSSYMQSIQPVMPGEHLDIDLKVAGNKSADLVSHRKLPALARTCDRYGIADRTAAAIATAVLEDFGIVNAFDTSNVIDPSKIRRERKRKHSQLKSSQDSKLVRGIYFDGRKDKTLENTKEGSKFYQRTITK